MRSALTWFLLAPLVAAGCARPAAAPPAAPAAPPSPPRLLSQLGLFESPLAEQRPAPGVFAYDLSTPLFSDYTHKFRFIRLPVGTAIHYQTEGVLSFPVGTVLVKTFTMPVDQRDPAKGQRLIETRILEHTPTGWQGWPYVWNDAQTDADLMVAGDIRPVTWIHLDGTTRENGHIVPNANQCKGCHEQGGAMTPLGPQVAFLNHASPLAKDAGSQLAAWLKRGQLKEAPAPESWPQAAAWNDSDADLNARARAWLDVNCAHCHNPRGPARNAGLDYRMAQSDPAKLGVWKAPVAAGRGTGGRSFDIVPGKPDESIMIFRLESTEPGIMMPELARRLVDAEGVALMRQWIANMPATQPAGSATTP